MKHYRLDPAAGRDLDEIYSYIFNENPSAAERLLEKIEKTFRLIAKEPLMGQAEPDILIDLRSFSVGNYVIYFRPAKTGVDIIRILHGARDVDSLFD